MGTSTKEGLKWLLLKKFTKAVLQPFLLRAPGMVPFGTVPGIQLWGG